MTFLDKSSCGNRLLRTLTDSDFTLLATRMTRVELDHRHVLVTANKPIKQVYFLEGGIASVVMTTPDSVPTEVGIFGRDGLSGVSVMLGSDRSPHETYMQIDGTTALVLKTEDFLEVLQLSASMRDLLLRFVQTFLVQTAASAVSNAHNRVEARLARWLLMCHDRLDGDDIHLTHEFMSMMIAAQRTRVTLTLHVLEGSGAIKSKRSRVTIVDRKLLEALAGDGYGQPEAEYRRLIGPFGRSES